MIEAMGLTREKVFLANLLKCSPPKDRNPIAEEIVNCDQFLQQQIEIIQPVVICTLGAFASQSLLQTDTAISQLRGKFYDYHGIRLLPTFHPAYLLKCPSEKRNAWEDLKMVKAAIGL